MIDIQRLIECWVDYVRFSRSPVPIQATTINCYLTHVQDWAITDSILPHSGASIRSDKCKLMLSGYSNTDFETLPASERLAIPLTYPLLCSLIEIVTTNFCDPIMLPLRRAIIAGFSLGYACSCRVAEYLRTKSKLPITHQVISSKSFFWWNTQYYSVCYPHLYPPGYPDHFTTTLVYAKNDTRGRGGPKAITRCLSVPADRDCCSTLFDFLKLHPPLAQSPLLSGLGPHLSRDLMLSQLHLLAEKHNLDKSRLKMHSSVRSGALVALENESDSTKLAQGCWSSVDGMLNYNRRSISHATHVTDLLHDMDLCPISYSQQQFGTALTSSIRVATSSVA